MIARLCMISALLLSPLFGKSISAGYDVTFSVFGKIGEALLSFDQDEGRYSIYINAGLTGSAASIGQNRREIHESFGIIENGVLLPELYKITRSSSFFFNESFFAFNHEDDTIERHRIRTKIESESHFDLQQMGFVTNETNRTTYSSNPIPFYAKNDILSLFFNVKSLLKEIPQGKEKLIHAVGGSNKKGEIIVTNPAGEKRRELASLMPTHENRLITVIVDQDIFKSDRGELYVSLDSDTLAKEAMLKDVLLFGDIHGYRVWQKEDEGE